MRKLKLQMQLSIDGFCAGPNGELDWMLWDFDEQLKRHLNKLTESVDCILLGRKLAEGFIPTWESRLANPEGEDMTFVRKMNDTAKIVFTRTLKKSDPMTIGWKKTSFAQDDLVPEIKKIKEQSGGDIIMYGGNNFASGVILGNLIDEYHLFVHPTFIGKGLTPFANRNELELVQSKPFPCGVVLLQYKPKN